MSVVNRQTIVIHKDLTGPIQSFSVPLNLQFTPTAVIVRTICLGDATLGGTLHGIVAPWSNSVNQVIGVFVDEANNPYMTNPNTTFMLENANMLMNGDTQFLLRGLTDTLVASTSVGKLALTLEFIREEEKQVKPQVADMTQLINYLKNSKESFYGLETFKGGQGDKSAVSDATLGEGIAGDMLAKFGEAVGKLFLKHYTPFGGQLQPSVKNALDQNVNPVVDIHPPEQGEIEEEEEPMEGEGFIKKVFDFGRQVITGRDKLGSKFEKRLNKFKDQKIKEVYIVRAPIIKGVEKALDLLNKGELKKEMSKAGYDDLFHLTLNIVLENGVCLRIEKNETVYIDRGCIYKNPKPETGVKKVEVKKDITLGEAYDKMTKGYPSASRLYGYDSVNNNCQRFVNTFLSQNKDAFNYTGEDKSFIVQDVRDVMKKFKKTKGMSKKITDLASRLSLFLTGGEMEQ